MLVKARLQSGIDMGDFQRRVVFVTLIAHQCDVDQQDLGLVGGTD